MSKTRVKASVGITEVSLQEAEKHLLDFANAASQIKMIQGEIELKVAQIRDQWQTSLAQYEAIQREAATKLQIFAETNRDVYFAKRKSLELTHGIIGFRMGNLSLKKPGNRTWEVITGILQKEAPEYVRTKQEPNKEALIADSSKLKALFEKTGLSISQTESFYVEPKEEGGNAKSDN